MKYDVFISYSSHDQKVVEGLCAYLEQRKIRCFVAYRDIPRGVVWARAIVEALDESRMMVVVFSDHFNNSDQVDREIELASEDKKPILTFRVTDDAFKGAKKYYLKNINWIDAFPDPTQVFGSVVKNVAKLLDMQMGVADPVKMPTPKPTVAPIKTYKVGDYYDDGKKQGVVFAVSDGGRHGKIVSLNQTDVRWCSDEEYKREIETGASDERNGMNNQRKIQQISGWREKYPAFAYCADQGEGWYLPAIEELTQFTLNDAVHDAVNRTLRAKGATKLFNKGVKGDFQWYWSSTESDYKGDFGWKFCAWYVGMGAGGTRDDTKDGDGYVRAVSAF